MFSFTCSFSWYYWSNKYKYPTYRPYSYIVLILVQEDDVNLLTIIKGNCKYRRSRKHDFIKDFIPPSMSEYKKAVETYG